MYSTTYHNGEYGIELFSPSGNDPFKPCKLNNEHNIKKLYDRSIKGYMVAIEKESATTSIQFPKNSKGSLMITQPVLVLQLQLHPERSFSMEIIVVDTDQQRRRFHLSTNFKEVDVNSLHVCIPWTQPGREQWANVVLNLDGLVAMYHTGRTAPTFFNLESFTIQPVCRIRKIFTLPLKYLGDEETGPLIPPKFDFTTGVDANSWVFAFDAAAPPQVLSARGESADRAAAVGGPATATPGPLGIVGKKVARKEAPSAAAAGASDAESAHSGRQKAAEIVAPAPVVSCATAAKQPHPLVPSLPPVSAPNEDTKPPAMVFSGRLKQKLTAVSALTPATALPLQQPVVAASSKHPTETDCSMLVDASAADIAVGEVSADISVLTDGGGEGRSRPETPPSAEDSANASTLTETEVSANNITTEVVLEAASPEVDEGVLERYLQLRQSMKRGEEPVAPVPVPHELAQSIHDYSAIEEYVSSYKLHQKLQHVRESLFLAEEEALGLARPALAAAQVSQGIAAMDEGDTAAEEQGETLAAPSPPDTPVAHESAPLPMEVATAPQLKHTSPVQPRAAPATPPSAPAAPTRRFVDAAVSPMPVMRSLQQPRLSHLSHASLPALPEMEMEMEAPILLDAAIPSDASLAASPHIPPAASTASPRPQTPEEAAAFVHLETAEPVLVLSAASASKDSQRGRQVPLSPFSEAVAYIQASQPSLRSSTEQSLGRSIQPVSRSAEAVVSSRSFSVDAATAGSSPGENSHPNVSPAQEDLTGSDFAVYKARSSALTEQYERSVDALLAKLEQKGWGTAAEPPRSPLQPSRPGTAASASAAGGLSLSRSGNTSTAVLATPLPEKRKRAIRARVAGLLKQVAQAEMEYIAEFGFEAFEREVGFFEDNLPLKRR